MVDRKGWVPVQPKRAVWWTPKLNAKGYDEHSCTMLPLKLCWAWTIWKAQGQTMKGKVVADISPKEREHGLAYIDFPRVTKFATFGLLTVFPKIAW